MQAYRRPTHEEWRKLLNDGWDMREDVQKAAARTKDGFADPFWLVQAFDPHCCSFNLTVPVPHPCFINKEQAERLKYDISSGEILCQEDSQCLPPNHK